MTQDLEFNTSIVINRCYGGFNLSEKAARELAALKGYTMIREDGFLCEEKTGLTLERLVRRDDPDLITVVSKLGKEASGACADLRVVPYKVVIEIANNDGMEKIETVYAQPEM